MSNNDNVQVKSLKFSNSFNQLTSDEKHYAYFFYKASWAGFPIILFNVSPEGPYLFVIFQKFFRSFDSVLKAKEVILKNTSVEDTNNFIEYAATVYDNAGNYRSFGYDKIYPKLSQESFEKILNLSTDKESILKLFNHIKAKIYDTSDNTKSIGLNDKGGVNNYYLNGITEDEIKFVDNFLSEIGILHLNTRLIKFLNSSGEVSFGYIVGSIDKKVVDHKNNIYGLYGDFSEFLADINKYISECKQFTNREHQIKMIDKYIESFKTGSVEAHKESQIEWVKDIKPVVETNIGWIETYIDPLGIRGYYEGMVALVDKENTKKFTNLVQNASKFLAPENIHWPEEIESYPFKEPDYTQIDVVCFGSNGCPLGINIPNYTDVVEKHGFKNVTIGNNLPSFKKESIQFMPGEQKDNYEKFAIQSMTLHTACHELLGHGSGKLLRKLKDGSFNFNHNAINPLTNKPYDTYYEANETYSKKFSNISSSYEECRADLNGLYFGKMPHIASIFNISEDTLEDVITTKWTMHFRKGLLGLKFYNETADKWGQAHVQGAYVFTMFIFNNQKKEDPILEIKLLDKNDFVIIVNKKAITSYGHDLVATMLTKFNIWKATADAESAKEFYKEHSKVSELFLEIRTIVIEKTPPRGLTINHNLIYDQELKTITDIEYEESCEGLITSFIDRFDSEIDAKILRQISLWDNI